jgi:hypothetical protein
MKAKFAFLNSGPENHLPPRYRMDKSARAAEMTASPQAAGTSAESRQDWPSSLSQETHRSPCGIRRTHVILSVTGIGAVTGPVEEPRSHCVGIWSPPANSLK